MISLRDTIPSSRFLLITISIICVHVVVFAVALMLGERGLEVLFYSLGIVLLRCTHPRLEPNYLTLRSSI